MIKDILFLLIAVPVILSFIILVWGIFFQLISMIVEGFQDWKDKK